MSYFDKAVVAVLEHEGGYNNISGDSGGATNFGISLKFLNNYTTVNSKDYSRFDIDKDGDIDAADIRGLTLDGAKYLYKKEFWVKHDYDRISNYLVARKIFDLAVNMGPKQAHKLTQRALRACGVTFLIEDGILGPKTFNAINGADQSALLAALRSEAAGFYRLLCKVDSKLERFLQGWLLRAYF